MSLVRITAKRAIIEREDNLQTGDWLTRVERRRAEDRLTYIGAALFVLAMIAVYAMADYGMVHPLLARIAGYLGVR